MSQLQPHVELAQRQTGGFFEDYMMITHPTGLNKRDYYDGLRSLQRQEKSNG